MSEVLSLEQIKELMAAMNDYNIGSFSLKTDDFEIKLKEQQPLVSAQAPATPHSTPTAIPQSSAPAAPLATPSEPALQGNIVTSPIVGTFYSSPAPDKPPYISIGSQVATGDTLFIIESMKLMNEVTSDYAGTVTKILVEDGQGVEYGQPIITIE